jgi:putative ABC transport system permease protein
VRALSGVVNASVITGLPFKGGGAATRFRVEGRPRPEMGQEPSTAVRMIQPRYFETMGIPILRGRDFTEADLDPKAPLRFVVSDTMVKRMFPNENPIGKHLVVNMKTNNEPGEIIGVAGDVHHGTLADKINAVVYYPQSHLSFGFGTLVVQTSADPMAFASPVRQVINRLDPDISATEVATMQRWIEDSVARPRFQTGLLASFAGLALLLAVLGIYGVMSYAVAQRTHEIGVRMALGAQRTDVARLVLSRGVFLTLLGLGIGIAGALALGRYLETLLFEVKPADPATLTAVVALLLAVAIAACLLPARRATRVDPMIALRYD